LDVNIEHVVIQVFPLGYGDNGIYANNEKCQYLDLIKIIVTPCISSILMVISKQLLGLYRIWLKHNYC